MSAPPAQPWWTRLAYEAHVGVLWLVVVVALLIPVRGGAFQLVGPAPAAAERSSPGWVGVEAAVTEGPLHAAVFGAEALLDVMYTASIHNLTFTAWTHGAALLTCCVYLGLYWLRSEREDVFMTRSNPDDRACRVAVPWKFLPGID